MPRKAKRTIANQPAQAVGAVPGQMYGAGVEQMQMQRSMPSPNLRSAPSPGPSAGSGGSPVARVPSEPPQPVLQPQPPVSEAERFQRAVDAASQLRGQVGVLRRSTDRPDEPVTAGLATGPGPGPTMLQMRQANPTAETLRRLSAVTGDRYFAELARRAGY